MSHVVYRIIASGAQLHIDKKNIFSLGLYAYRHAQGVFMGIFNQQILKISQEIFMKLICNMYPEIARLK